jgi:hypothetical protein
MMSKRWRGSSSVNRLYKQQCQYDQLEDNPLSFTAAKKSSVLTRKLGRLIGTYVWPLEVTTYLNGHKPMFSAHMHVKVKTGD